jgi:hypothetical protein
MSKGAWGGLITNASPFALPAGAAVEQVNLACDIAGQIYTRGGMWPIAFSPSSGSSAGLVDCHPYSRDGQSWLLCLRDDGTLVALQGPAYGPEPERPIEPQLEAEDAVGSSYTMRYVVDVDEPPPDPPTPDPTQLYSTLRGGRATTSSWSFAVNANALCEGSGKLSAFRSGSAGSSVYPPSVAGSELCAP